MTNKACLHQRRPTPFHSLLLLVFTTFLLTACDPDPPPRLLFIGNSFTYFHNMPLLLEELAQSADPLQLIETEMVVRGGVAWQAEVQTIFLRRPNGRIPQVTDFQVTETGFSFTDLNGPKDGIIKYEAVFTGDSLSGQVCRWANVQVCKCIGHLPTCIPANPYTCSEESKF